MLAYILPIFIVLSIETPLYFELGKKKNIFVFIALILMNVVSNLSFNLVLSSTNFSVVTVIIGEIIVFIIESLVLYIIFKKKYMILLCFFGNMLSWGMGYLLNNFYIKGESELFVASLIFEVIFSIYFIIRISLLVANFIKNLRKSSVNEVNNLWKGKYLTINRISEKF